MWWFFSWFVMNEMINVCLYVLMYIEVVLKVCMIGVYKYFVISACRCIFLCTFVWDCRRNLIICGRIFAWCAAMYAKMRVICINLFIRRPTKTFDECTGFFHSINAGIRSQWNYICKSFSHAIFIENIIQFSWILSRYYSCGYHWCDMFQINMSTFLLSVSF